VTKGQSPTCQAVLLALLSESKMSHSLDTQLNFLLGIKKTGGFFQLLFYSALFCWVFSPFLPFPEGKAMTARQNLVILRVPLSGQLFQIIPGAIFSPHRLLNSAFPGRVLPMTSFCIASSSGLSQGFLVCSCALSLQGSVPGHFTGIGCAVWSLHVFRFYTSSENSSVPFDVPLDGVLFFFLSFFPF